MWNKPQTSFVKMIFEVTLWHEKCQKQNTWIWKVFVVKAWLQIFFIETDFLLPAENWCMYIKYKVFIVCIQCSRFHELKIGEKKT